MFADEMSDDAIEQIFDYELATEKTRGKYIRTALRDSSIEIPTLNVDELEGCSLHSTKGRLESFALINEISELAGIGLACVMCLRSHVQAADIDGTRIELPVLCSVAAKMGPRYVRAL